MSRAPPNEESCGGLIDALKRARVLAAVAGVLASVALAAPASAFTAPELFVRMQRWDTHEAAGDWIPLASAPALNYLVAAGPELQFEGDGAYTVTVSVGPGSGGASGCLSAPSTTASLAVDVHVAPTLAGEPRSFRAVALPGNPFVGVQAPAPPGGEADIRCALNATVQTDGSVAGSHVVPDPSFSHPTSSSSRGPACGRASRAAPSRAWKSYRP